MRPSNEQGPAAPDGGPGDDTSCAGYRQVLGSLQELRPHDSNLAVLMKTIPVRELSDRTLQESVLAGDSDKALLYLQAISGGHNR